MSEPGKKRATSTEIIATRSDYKKGKQDGLAEAIALVHEAADKLDKGSAEEVVLRKTAKELWFVYRRRQV